MSWLAAIALTQIVVGLFWLMTRWPRLGPWNPEKKIALHLLAGEMFLNGIPHFVFAYVFMRAVYPLMLLALVYYPLWFFYKFGVRGPLASSYGDE
jgi:hypothetical protein